ncbi:cytochrome c biogenesis protein CcdC [Paenibacillus hemerocallicola]|uniref:Cytochrome c biogenesis protein CcdC n=1 Tax=Paenibacillus hemerocallicola TaxID=1172614 RepID=A0A5C4T7U6_9BACL|nr:cytochrome c biogenesis protein CcdC [Paenibacillus hemerocallicola]
MFGVSTLSIPQIAPVAIALIGGIAVIAVRLKASAKPTSLKKILMPPLGMSTGFAMFLFPFTHIPWLWAAAALLAGALLFSYPLIWSSKFEIRDGDIYLVRSKAFVFMIIGLLVVRLLLHDLVERAVSIPQTGALFFLLAFGMIVPWRLAMARRYRAKLDSLAGRGSEAGGVA